MTAHRTVGDIVGRNRSVVQAPAGGTFQHRDPLLVIVAVGPRGAVAESDAVGDFDDDFGAAIVVQVGDSHAIPMPDIDRRRTGFNIVLVGTVRTEAYVPQKRSVVSV